MRSHPLNSWQQALTSITGHINNLYNTTFWALILKGGMDNKEAEKALAVCDSFYALTHI